MSGHQQQQQQHNTRLALDRLFATDATISVAFGLGTLVAPHFFIAQLVAATTGYNHSVHETLRCVDSTSIAFVLHLSGVPFVSNTASL